MTLEISKAVRGDIDSVLRIADDCGLAPWTKSDCLSESERAASIFLVARTGKADVSGFILGRVLPGPSPASNVAEIYNIGVLPASRRSGIGSTLLREFFSAAAKHSVTKVFLEVRSSNFGAIEFYETRGFEAYSTRPSFYRDPPDDATLMRAEVSPLKGGLSKEVA